MATVTLKIEVQKDLYDEFHKAATDKKGKWRGGEQSVEKALQTAVQAALLCFLDSLKKPDLATSMIKTLIE
jgi:hypothetical protein